jgi:cytochrome c-type biogenesis protein CcmH/NrfG
MTLKFYSNLAGSAQLEKALRFNPDHPEALYNLSMAYRKLGRGEESQIAYRKAKQIRPDLP